MYKRFDVVSSEAKKYACDKAMHPWMDPEDIPCPGCNEEVARRCFVCNEVRLFGGEVKGADSIIAAQLANSRS